MSPSREKLTHQKAASRASEATDLLDWSEQTTIVKDDRDAQEHPLRAFPKSGDVLFHRYRLGETLGAGGYGRVFSAWDLRRERRVAIKILHHSDPAAIKRFKHEFRAFNQLQHPNLVRIFKLGREGETWYIVMEEIDGIPFIPRPTGISISRALSKRNGTRTVKYTTRSAPFLDLPDEPLQTLWHIDTLRPPTLTLPELHNRFGQLCKGTMALHRIGIVHCDLKPSNILLTPDERVVILDFGVSRHTAHLAIQHRDVGAYAGTRPYMAPEMTSVEHATPAFDWYALGMILAEVLICQPARLLSLMPYDALRDTLKRAAEAYPEYQEAYRLCAALLEPDPDQRANHRAVLSFCYGQRAAHITRDIEKKTGVFIARERELHELHHAYQQFLDGRAGVVIVEGESGVGKSTLCNEFLRRIALDTRPPYLLLSHCQNDELIGYRAFDALVDGIASIIVSLPADERANILPYCTPALCALFPTLRSVDPSLQRLTHPSSSEDALFALHALMVHIAQDRRIVICVEDVHLADHDSLRWLARIFTPGTRPNALLILSQSPSGDLVDDHVDINTLGYAVSRIAIHPFDEHTTQRLLQRQLPAHLANDPTLIDTLLSIGGGNPRALIRACRNAENIRSTATDVSLNDMLPKRMASLSDTEQEILAVLALSREPIDIQRIRAVANCASSGVNAALESLLQYQWIHDAATVEDEYYEISGQTIRRNALAKIDEDKRQQIHARFVASIRDNHAGALRASSLIFHLIGANMLAEAEQQAHHLAKTAVKTGAYDTSSQFYTLLLDIHRRRGRTPDEAVQLQAVDAQLRSGRLLDAADLLTQLANNAATDEHARAYSQRAAETYTLCGHFQKAAAQHRLAHARARTPLKLRAPRIVRMLALFTQLRKKVEQLDIAQTSLEPFNEDADTEIRNYRMAGLDVGIVAPISGFEFALYELQFALRTGRQIPISRALAGLATFISATGGAQRRTALRWTDIAAQLADKSGDRISIEWAKIGRASIEYHRGDYGKAWTQLNDAAQWLEAHASQQSMMLAYVDLHRVYLAYMTGRTEQLRTIYYAQIVESRASNNRMMEATVTFPGFVTWLLDDAPEAGRAVLDRIKPPRVNNTYQLYDFFLHQYSAELALYEQNVNEYQQHIQQLGRYERAPIAWSLELTRLAGRFLRGRLILAIARETNTLSRRDELRLRYWARGLCRNEDALANCWGRLLLMGICMLKREQEDAKAYLIDTIASLNNLGVHLYAEVVRAAGRISGLLPHEPASSPWLELQEMGVVHPERFTRGFLPWI